MSKPVRLELLCWEGDWLDSMREGQEGGRLLWMISELLTLAWLMVDTPTRWNVEEQEKETMTIDIGPIKLYQR
jgi:hypothetical protein